jgi:hypothetical protein
MKNIRNIFCLGAVGSLIVLFSACGPSGSNGSNQGNATDTSALDTGSQYGQQPRDSTNTRGAGDSIEKTGTGKGNADPSGGTQKH